MVSSRICPRCQKHLPEGLDPKDCPTCLVNAVCGPAPDELAGARKLLGVRIGDYDLVHFIARGGMGDVYCAHQPELERDVAFKIARADLVLDELSRHRFQTDARVAAQLEHANIIAIYDVGESEGRPYFSMQLMDGCSLADLLDAERREGAPPPSGTRLRFALELIVKVARAAHYAHTKGVLHRDLKPGNILLNQAKEPFLTDFGLALRVEEDVRMTMSREIIGTPCYMSPEQADGATGDITIYSDIYGLGAILYELLTLRPPHLGKTFPEILHKVTHNEITRPRVLNQNIPRDLETICLKCLAREPERRYASAEALAGDLDHYLRGEPIMARPVPWWERLWKWIRRKPAKAGLIGVATASAVLLFMAIMGIKRQVDRYYQQKGFTQAVTQFEAGKPASAVAALSRLVETYPDFDLAADRLICALTQHPFPMATLPHSESNRVTDLAYSPDGRHLVTAEESGTNRVWHTLRGELVATLARSQPTHQPTSEPDGAQCVLFHPNGEEILAGYSSGRIETWNWRRQSLEHVDTMEGLIRAIRVLPDGKRIVVLSTRELRVSEPASGRTWRAQADTDDYFSAAFDRQGRYVAVGHAEDGSISLWTATQATLVSRWKPHASTVRSLQFSEDGNLLVSSSDDGTVCLRQIHAPNATPIIIPHDQQVWSAILEPFGHRLLTLTGDHQLRFWDVATGKRLYDLAHKLPRGDSKDHHMLRTLFHPQGGFLLTACDDGMVRIWNASSGDLFGPPAVHEFPTPYNEYPFIDAMVFSNDGSQFATTGADGAVRLWAFPGRQLALKPFHSTSATGAYWLSREDRWAWFQQAQTLQALSLLPQNGHPQRIPSPPARAVFPAPNAPTALVETESGQTLLVGMSLSEPEVLATNQTILQAGWNAEGSRFWIRAPRRLTLHERANPGQPIAAWPMESGILWSELSPDEHTMGWASNLQLVLEPLPPPRQPQMQVSLPGPFQQGRFSADGSRLLITSPDGLATLVDTGRGRMLSVFRHDKEVQAADLSGDGAIVATLTAGKDLAIWRAGRSRKPWLKHELDGFRANSIALSRDGTRLALASPSQFLLLVDVESGRALSDPIPTEGSVRNVRFGDKGTWMVADLQESPILWAIPPDVSRAPNWLALMGQTTADLLLGNASSSNGAIVGSRQVLSRALGGASQLDDTVRWATWFYADPHERTVASGSQLRALDYLTGGVAGFHRSPQGQP